MAPDKKTKGSYSVGLATRAAILHAAMELISESGYHGISLRDVARRVGISHPAVIYHFPSKEALMREVVVEYERAFGIIEITRDPETDALSPAGVKVDDMLGIAFQLMRLSKHPDMAILLDLVCVFAVEAAIPGYPVHEHFRARSEMIIAFIAKDLERLRDEGVLSFRLKPRTMALSMMSSWHGILLQERNRGEEGVASYENTISRFLAAAALILQVTPEVQVRVSAKIPEDVGDVYLRAVRAARELVG